MATLKGGLSFLKKALLVVLLSLLMLWRLPDEIKNRQLEVVPLCLSLCQQAPKLLFSPPISFRYRLLGRISQQYLALVLLSKKWLVGQMADYRGLVGGTLAFAGVDQGIDFTGHGSIFAL